MHDRSSIPASDWQNGCPDRISLLALVSWGHVVPGPTLLIREIAAFPSLVLTRLVDSHAPADSIRGATVSLSRHKYGSESERDSSLPIAKSIHTTVKMLVSPDASV